MSDDDLKVPDLGRPSLLSDVSLVFMDGSGDWTSWHSSSNDTTGLSLLPAPVNYPALRKQFAEKQLLSGSFL